MPVKWLYILKDGTLVPAKAAGTAGDVEVVVPPARQKTAQGDANTVVGRVAFWTDDETAKVNINTASEGTYWDTPVSNSQPGGDQTYLANTYQTRNETTFEWDLAERQGAQKEYQRYPGHPATTCLSTIFGSQLLQKPEVGGDRTLMAEEIFKIIPRVTGAEYDPSDITYASPTRDYSSKAGTIRAGGGQTNGEEEAHPVVPDGDRLYATIDEFLYNPNFASTRRPWTLAQAASKRDTTREMLEMSKFFLTASSKSPEQNLYNLPRIAIWPERTSDTQRTAFDKLIAFCSTVGPKTDPSSLPYYFTRQNGNSTTADLSPRNVELMAYLKGLTGRPVPGWDPTGSATRSFAAKYSGGDRDQILTEIFDYIRSTNLADNSDSTVASSYTQIEASTAFPNVVGFFGRSSSLIFLPDATHSTRGQVTPIEMADGSRGIGRIMTISELALIATAKRTADQTKSRIQIALVPKFFSPMAGYSVMANAVRFTFDPINITVSDKNGTYNKNPFLGVTQPTIYDIGHIHDPDSWVSSFGGSIGWASLCNLAPAPAGTPDVINGRSGNLRNGRPDSAPPTGEIILNKDPNNRLTIGGTVTVTVTSPPQQTATNTTGEPVIQTIKFKFPPFTIPVPVYKNIWGSTRDETGTEGGPYIVDGGTGSNRVGTRWENGTEHYLVSDADAVRSLVATGNNLQGDMRLIAARKDVDESYFQPNNLAAYNDPTLINAGGKNTPTKATHSMRQGLPHFGAYRDFGAFGSLVAGTSMQFTNYNDADGVPDLPIGIAGVVNSLGQPGDWDNGPFIIPDGPFCNKPDEGTRRHQSDPYTPYIGSDYIHQDWNLQQTTFFSPNRMLPSAVMFGSLPTGVKSNKPWQTLLFRPTKSYLPGGANHPGSAKWGPPDHLLLDLFWMPVVEPYAISEPFATAGKINLNQQIAPFTNIKRDTGLRAVMKSVKLTALNPDQPDQNGTAFIRNYKTMGTGHGGGLGVATRRNIDLENTLKQISDRLARNKPFVSASEICDISLIPQDVPLVGSMRPHVSAGFTPSTSLSSFDSLLGSFWERHKLTGDNSLEKPYAYIYPRLTTRSNSYTVHVRVQTLAQNTRNSSYILKASQSQPTGEFRGSFLLERYLDANSATIVDSAGNPKAVPASGDTTGLALGPYRFRVVSSKQFVP
ncbi:MAG: Verru_Chthon cassette protein A, partial [Verrucomicrobia bacterium]|nr:Verru_Chthon cassette protein A [Verrucomicrobiota bacterium]